jgi:uncharacterized protein (DUF2141 family)
MSKKHLIPFLLLFACTFLSMKPVTNSTVTISFSGCRNNKGQMCVLLFNSEKGYYDQTALAYKSERVPIKNQAAVCTFNNLPFGEYAIVALHDENFNNKMDFSIIGTPAEGLGVSNNAISWWKPKPFPIAKFKVSQAQQKIAINVTY